MTRPIARVGALGFCLLLAAHTLALAEDAATETFPPVEHASFHQLVFADDDLAILNNLYPPNGDSGFHTHYRDLFAVIVQASQSSGQVLGKPLTAAPTYAAGAAVYSAVGAESRTHRVVTATRTLARSSSSNYAVRNPWERPSPRVTRLPNTYRLSRTHGCGPGD